ncbi:hypothetical protein BY996DRAFT_6481808 [Phakopsora pachyrhizi]|uniref:Uncharacterized protein n=1 Tax=Phakopsora pachyrhizi TaxID=170000 RepID=A0AAV0B3P7_PHAPC|nr:hypothetical protein BY996DRAFT_6481808 [Phakopsora pachyrhizi]CAH7678002.1 hypothetical protein PPACK8108_LOCUS12894 [Phakopsora pachyrhizi]
MGAKGEIVSIILRKFFSVVALGLKHAEEAQDDRNPRNWPYIDQRSPMEGRQMKGYESMEGRMLRGYEPKEGQTLWGYEPKEGRNLKGYEPKEGRKDMSQRMEGWMDVDMTK